MSSQVCRQAVFTANQRIAKFGFEEARRITVDDRDRNALGTYSFAFNNQVLSAINQIAAARSA